MIRYFLLRMLVFFACLAALWLAGLRERNEQPWLIVGAGVLSIIVSAFVLKPFREDVARQLEERAARRIDIPEDAVDADSDEAAEDSEVEQRERAAEGERVSEPEPTRERAQGRDVSEGDEFR
ncbi:MULTISPECIES: DUF4229 domain-containing protein [unclassified Janibacter]|uniref:DUF4229 domain-containing protein n=1 Tax=unclassified Janibacter TaxID=2649294 RepID=UPI003CFC485E